MTRPLQDWTNERLLYMYTMLNVYNPNPTPDYKAEFYSQYFSPETWREALEDAKREILIRMQQ